MKSVVITGVSTGIGHATVKVLLEQGFHVFGSVRQQDDAEHDQEAFQVAGITGITPGSHAPSDW